MLERRDFCGRALGLAAGLGAWRASACPWCVSAADKDSPFAALPASAWTHARKNGLVMVRRPVPRQLSPVARIAAQNEPGERLTVTGQLFAPDGRTPAAGVTLYAYNTDAAGYYGENRAELPPRLYGWMRTGPDGRFELHTILPGHYPGMQVPRHIHFSAWGAGYPPQWFDDLRFTGDRFLTSQMIEEDAALGAFRRILPLARKDDGWVLGAPLRMRLAPATNFL